MPLSGQALTTLLGLLGSVVLFKGGSLVTGVTANGGFQVVLIVLVSLPQSVTQLAEGDRLIWPPPRCSDVTDTQPKLRRPSLKSSAATVAPPSRRADLSWQLSWPANG